jgi:HxlR-like helix-turn-helix
VLTARLNHLVEAGVLEKVRYSERPPRHEYHLTAAGQELRSVLLLLARWGDRHLAERPPVVFRHTCGADLDPAVVCRECGEEVQTGSLAARFQVEGWGAAGLAR